LLQTDAANRVLRSLGKLLTGLRSDGSADLPVDRIVIRRSEETGELLVGLHTPRTGEADIGGLARRLIELHPDVRGVVQLHTPHGRRGGIRTRVVAGRGQILERVAGFRFDLPATSFFQVSTPAARALLDLVVRMAPPLEHCNLLDLYGGVGLYALELLRRGAASATVCEADLEAVRCGRDTAFRHRIRGIRYQHADVRRFLAGLGDRANPQLVVLNPPRAGLGKGVSQAVRALAAGRLIVISCDPATLARDLATLTEGDAYSIDRIVPLDLFPQTAHVEVVVSLSVRPGFRAAGRRRRLRGSSRQPTSD
jgi:23S rRNA (uracil1939-C5)-methyltransferase